MQFVMRNVSFHDLSIAQRLQKSSLQIRYISDDELGKKVDDTKQYFLSIVPTLFFVITAENVGEKCKARDKASFQKALHFKGICQLSFYYISF